MEETLQFFFIFEWAVTLSWLWIKQNLLLAEEWVFPMSARDLKFFLLNHSVTKYKWFMKYIHSIYIPCMYLLQLLLLNSSFRQRIELGFQYTNCQNDSVQFYFLKACYLKKKNLQIIETAWERKHLLLYLYYFKILSKTLNF